jgi:hypothetical protein
LPETLAAARTIQNESYRISVLSVLAGNEPSVLPEVLVSAGAIKSEYYRAYVLSALAYSLQLNPTVDIFTFWQDILHELSLRTRPDLLQDIKSLFPIIFALGGKTATAELARAIVDVARWWR